MTADFDGNIVNAAIDRWEEIGRRAYRYFMDRRRVPTSEEFSAKIAELSASGREEPKADPQFLAEYLANIYIPRYQNVRGLTR